MHKILVGTDTSASAELAVDAAADLARSSGAELVVMCVTPVLDPRDVYDPWGPREQVRHLEAIAGRLAGQPVATLQVPGDPATALCQVAVAEGADLIVVGNRGLHGRRRLLASVPQAVLQHSPCSVLVVDTRSAQ